MRIVIINGKTGSGKDTFVKMVADRLPTFNIHSSDVAYEILKMLGWDGVERTPEIRDFMAYIMERSRTLFDGITKDVLERVDRDLSVGYAKNFVFIHVREAEQIKRLYDEYYPLADVMWIERDVEIPAGITNASDLNVEEYKDYDFVINNNGSLEDLSKEVDKWLREVNYGKEY